MAGRAAAKLTQCVLILTVLVIRRPPRHSTTCLDSSRRQVKPGPETSIAEPGGKTAFGTYSSVGPSSGRCSQVKTSEAGRPRSRPSSKRNATGRPAVWRG